MIRFHLDELDEHVSHDIARGLVLRGVNATTSTYTGLLGASDQRQLAYAASERRVIVTHDSDFLAAAADGDEHVGIVFVSRSRSIGEVIRYLCLLHDCLAPDELLNHVEYL